MLRLYIRSPSRRGRWGGNALTACVSCFAAAVITTDATLSTEALVNMTKQFDINGVDCIKDVTTGKVYEWNGTTDKEWEFSRAAVKSKKDQPLHIVAYDFGIKSNILRRLGSYGCRVTVVPASTPASEVRHRERGLRCCNATPRGSGLGRGWGFGAFPPHAHALPARESDTRASAGVQVLTGLPTGRPQVLKLNPDGVFFSNGPGDPSAVPYAVANAKDIIGKVPTFGICMGHQVMGQAFGGKTFKLSFGHHGGNHPIRSVEEGASHWIRCPRFLTHADPAPLPTPQRHVHRVDRDLLPEPQLCGGPCNSARRRRGLEDQPQRRHLRRVSHLDRTSCPAARNSGACR